MPTVCRQSLKASGSWNHHYQEQQHRTKGAECQGRGNKARDNKSIQSRQRAVWENYRSGGLLYVPGDEFHGQTRVGKANKCLLNKWVINGKAGEQSQASGSWYLSGSSLCGSYDWHPRGAGAMPATASNEHEPMQRPAHAQSKQFIFCPWNWGQHPQQVPSVELFHLLNEVQYRLWVHSLQFWLQHEARYPLWFH